MMYAQRQVVNYDLLVVMNGHEALRLPLFAAAEVQLFQFVCAVLEMCITGGHINTERRST